MMHLLLSFLLLWPGTQELDQLVNALQAKYARLVSLAADFTQLYTAPGERARRESGRLLLKKPGKMRWDYTAPEPKLYVSDGKVIYEYVPAERLATRTRVKEASDLRAPFMFLLGRGNLRRDFQRLELAAEPPTHAGNRVLRLVPRREPEIRELLIEVEPASLALARLSFIDRHGARSDFLFTNLRENIDAADSQFDFRPPAGVAVTEP
jgi:outer membrane lipoprotein carrier protein